MAPQIDAPATPTIKFCEACGSPYDRRQGVSRRQFERSRACSRSCSCRLGHPVRKWPSLDERFWEKVSRSPGLGPKGDCWEWTANKLPFGYGIIHVGQRCLKAHRLSYEMKFGPIPEGLIVRHRCDNPSCVRPDHLEVGTQQDNCDDMVSRGRAVSLRGEDQPNAKLTEAQAREAKFGKESQSVLAARFGVLRGTIASIRKGRTWAHLMEDAA